MKEIALSKFRATCRKVVLQVQASGEPVRITRHGVPIARLEPEIAASTGRNSWLGCWQGRGAILGDLIAPATDQSDWESLAD